MTLEMQTERVYDTSGTRVHARKEVSIAQDHCT